MIGHRLPAVRLVRRGRPPHASLSASQGERRIGCSTLSVDTDRRCSSWHWRTLLGGKSFNLSPNSFRHGPPGKNDRMADPQGQALNDF